MSATLQKCFTEFGCEMSDGFVIINIILQILDDSQIFSFQDVYFRFVFYPVIL